MTTPNRPSPETFFENVNAYQRTAALKAGVELELFTAIAEGADTVKAIATQCKASERGIRVLADYLTIIHLLTKSGDRYAADPRLRRLSGQVVASLYGRDARIHRVALHHGRTWAGSRRPCGAAP